MAQQRSRDERARPASQRHRQVFERTPSSFRLSRYGAASMHLFVALHVFAVTVWIGSIACVGWLVAAGASAPSEKEGATAAELAFGLYRRAASPAFGIAFFTGLARLLADSSTYMS